MSTFIRLLRASAAFECLVVAEHLKKKGRRGNHCANHGGQTDAMAPLHVTACRSDQPLRASDDRRRRRGEAVVRNGLVSGQSDQAGEQRSGTHRRAAVSSAHISSSSATQRSARAKRGSRGSVSATARSTMRM